MSSAEEIDNLVPMASVEHDVMVSAWNTEKITDAIGIIQFNLYLGPAQGAFIKISDDSPLRNPVGIKILGKPEYGDGLGLELSLDCNSDAGFEMGIITEGLCHIVGHGAMRKYHGVVINIDSRWVGLE